MRLYRTATRDERGATAIVVVLLLSVILGMGALAVDMGNAWARKRQVQNQADLAVLAGAGKLPDATAAISTAFNYLDGGNLVRGNASSWTLGQFTDGVTTNGEITVTNSNQRITVVAPPARVDFGLAGIFGQSGVDLQARAAAEIRTPGRPLPFFIPAGCANAPGRVVLKANAQSGSTSGPSSEPAPEYFTPNGGNQAPTTDTVSPLTINSGQPAQLLEIYGDKYTTSQTMYVGFVRGPQVIPPRIVTVPVGNVQINQRPVLDVITIEVPSEVYSVPGIWYVQVRAGTGNWTKANGAAEFKVSTGATTVDQCGEKSTGDFGMADSPRANPDGSEMTQAQQRLDMNIALGIDHDLQLFTGSLPPDTQADNCRQSPSNNPIPGGQLDVWATRDGANCMNIDNGNKVDATTDGLILGGPGYAGKLDKDTTPGCAPDGGSARYTVIGRDINNDVLSCFLRSTDASNDDVQDVYGVPQGGDPVLTSDVVNSPRFFFVPVLHYRVNPPNGFYPLVGWRGAFITDETGTARKGASNATSSNGLGFNNSKVSEITISYFYLDALPDQVNYSGVTTKYIGSGPRVVRLVE